MSLKEKLLSRKLWLAIIGAASGVAIAFGADASLVQVIVGAATALVSVAIYIITEGKIDAEAVTLTSDLAQQIIDLVAAVKELKASEAK